MDKLHLTLVGRLSVNYPAITDGVSTPRSEDFLLLSGNLLYNPLRREFIAYVSCPQALRAVPTPHEEN
ncbi:MAG: hypothetical protein RXN92_05810 [Thermoplasmatales archaeon]